MMKSVHLIYANGRKVGRKKNGNKFWVSEDPAVLTYVETDEVQAVNSRVQMDPLGVVTATGPGPGGTPSPGSTSNPQGYYGNPANAGAGCRLDGAPYPCDWLARTVNGGGGVYCPNNDCGPRQAVDKHGTPISGVYEWFNPTPGDNWHSTTIGRQASGQYGLLDEGGNLLYNWGGWKESFRPAGSGFLDASGDLIAEAGFQNRNGNPNRGPNSSRNGNVRISSENGSRNANRESPESNPILSGNLALLGKTFNCFNKWRFSSTIAGLAGEQFRGFAEALEIGSDISFASDILATMAKAERRGIAGPSNDYASGINRLFRAVGKTLKLPSSVRKGLTVVGDRLTPALATVAVFANSYNAAIFIQCATGVLE